MKNFLRKPQMSYQSIDDIVQNTQGLLLQIRDKPKWELPSPIMFELTNPIARFSLTDTIGCVVESAAESLYLLSGMNGNDFIWEFRGWKDPRVEHRCDEHALGPSLRFCGLNSAEILDYHRSNAIRQHNSGFIDQLAVVIETFKKDKTADTVLQFASIKKALPVHNVWFYHKNGKIEMLVSAGQVNNWTLYHKIIAPFAFLHQIISDAVKIPMGSSRFMIGSLYATEAINSEPRIPKAPIINMYDFSYPNGELSLRDIDTLMSIMVEYVSRLDENSLGRANPFQGDDRIQMWQDYASLFKVWKANKLHFEIDMPYFFHPQLRCIFNNGAVV
jgi:hypothetical protein